MLSLPKFPSILESCNLDFILEYAEQNTIKSLIVAESCTEEQGSTLKS